MSRIILALLIGLFAADAVSQPTAEKDGEAIEDSNPTEDLSSFPAPKKLETEWLGVELPLIGLFSTNIDMPISPGIIVRLITYKWEYFYWTPFEIGGAIQAAEFKLDHDLPSNSGAQYLAFAGTQAGWPLYLGGFGQHQLFLGISTAFGILGGEIRNAGFQYDKADIGLLVGAGIRYTYQPGGVFNYGASVRTFFPVVLVDESSSDPFRMLFLVSLDASLPDLEASSESGAVRMAASPFVEYVGIEWGFLSVFAGQDSPPPLAGISTIFRFWTLNWENFYWTPWEMGGGVHIGDSAGFSFYGGTQAGLQFELGTTSNHRLRFGLGLGGGALSALSTDSSCDGSCVMGGAGFMVSPTIRYNYYTEGRTFYGGGLRVIVPLQPDIGPLGGYGDLYGTLLSLYLEIGWGQKGPETSRSALASAGAGLPEDKGDSKPEVRTLSISTEPAQAWVMVDGLPIGESPVSINVPAGQHNVRVGSKGCRTWVNAVDVSSDRTLGIKLLEQSPLVFWGHMSFWTGLGLVGFGGLSTWMAKEAGLEGRNADSRAWSGAMWAGYAGGAALLTTGIVLWLLEPYSNEPATDNSITVFPTFDGDNLGIDVGMRF
ncbi:MAG: PEGA domain-containing protein [Deltaproteobacteria bacterium]|nr:PEGA domain-containing protein [Deltaproteobacteria bacterium]